MSDVTRWVIDRDELLLSDSEVGIIVGGNLMRDPVDVVTHADHLAALERVRVETLREAKRAVINNDGWLDAMKAIDKAIDRLLDATTTGATDA